MSNSKSNKQFPIGFTAVDNRIFYMQDRLSPNAFSVFIRIYRMSEGYDSTLKSLSNTYFQRACNVSKNTVTRSVKELELLGIINVQRRARANSLYSINLETVDNLYKSSIDESQKDVSLEPSDVTDVSQNRVGTKQNLIKQNNTKENINIPFDSFWDLYDYKKNKSLCVTKWYSMTDEERILTIESLDKYKQSTPDKTFRKYPLNYLENECWNDEHIVIVNNQNYAHNNKYNYGNANTNNVFSASHTEFEPVITAQEAVKDTNSTKHTKDDLECNLEALGISSGKGLDDRKTKDCTIKDNNNKNINTPVDIVALSSQVHWSELKARGMLKNPVNTNAVIPNTDTDKKINDFLSRNSSKRFGGICKEIA